MKFGLIDEPRHQKVMGSLELFATEVIPHFRVEERVRADGGALAAS